MVHGPIVVIGGFTTGKRALEPVAEAAIGLGYANDAEVLNFRHAMEDWHAVKKKARNGIVISHSAGSLAVARSLAAPELFVAYNGPEPLSIPRLALSANRKTAQHLRSIFTDNDRAAYSRIVASNAAEMTAHPFGNLKHIRAISRFSTLSQLAYMNHSGQRTLGVVTDGDVFFPPEPSAVPQGVQIESYAGDHDRLLADPKTLLSCIAERL